MACNPVFVPEARLDVGPYNALYTYGEAKGFGFSPFGVDSLLHPAASSQIAARPLGTVQQPRTTQQRHPGGTTEQPHPCVSAPFVESASHADGVARGISLSNKSLAVVAGEEPAR